MIIIIIIHHRVHHHHSALLLPHRYLCYLCPPMASLPLLSFVNATTRITFHDGMWVTLGTRPEKIRIQKWYTVYKDHITLEDYEIRDGMGLEMVSESRSR